MIHKNRYNRRKIAYYKSKRKSDLVKEIYGAEVLQAMTKGSILHLSKAKIHCSCGMCSEKSKAIGNKKVNSIRTYCFSDQRKLFDCKEQLKSW